MAIQSQKAQFTYLKSKQILHFGFARQNTEIKSAQNEDKMGALMKKWTT